MIVDDDRTMGTLLRTLLELEGYAVIVASEGAMVLDAARSERPDVMLMDVHLATADGLELLRQLRQDAGLETLPVIMTSGSNLEDECRRAGANSFILKPYPPIELTALLKKVIV